jgi:hypothetical protein
MSCRIGINNLVKSVIKDKPWFYFNERENYVEILDSPTNRISRYTAFGVAKSLAKDLNKVINNGYKQIGDVFYPNYMNQKRIVEINPSKKQLDLIKATDEKEVLEIEAEIKKEQLQKEFDFLNNEANISINYEGDVIPNIDNTVDNKKNITKQKNILYSIRTKSVEEIAKGLNTDLVRSEQQIKYSSYIKTMILTFMGDIGPGKKLKMSPDEAFQKSKEMFIKINNNIATALNTHIKSEEDFLKVKESTSYEEIIKIFPVLKYAKTYEDLQKAAKTYSDVIAKFDSYVTFVKIDLAHNGIRIVKNKIKNVDVEELAVKNEDESNDSSEISQNEIGERYGMDNFQTNPRDTASIRVKSLIQTIAIPDEYEFGVPIYANPNDVFADILEIGADIELSGFDSDKTKLTEFKKQLSDRAKSRTYLSNLLNKIESFEKNNEWERINDILTVASKAYAIETLLLYKTRKTGSQINGIYDAKIISTNRDSIDLQISKEWLFNHLQSDFYTKNSQKDLFPKQSKIDLLNQIIEEGANKENSIQIKKFQEFFNVLGIDFTENEVNIISKKLPKVLKKATFNAFFQKNNLLKNIVESFELNIKQPFEGQYGFKNESTSMKELAKIYYELNPGKYKIASTKTADNKSKYAYILPTYLEQVKREWDNGNTSSVMNGVLSKPNSQDQESFWNKVLRNQAKFKIDYFNGIREQKAGENGKVRKFLTPKEQIATMFLLHQQNLNVGSYIAFTLSDKTANMETVMTKEFFVNTSNSAVGVNIDYALADNKIVYTNALKKKIYNSFVEPEISRILASIKNKESVNIENYDIASKLFYFLPNLNRNSNLIDFRNDLYSGSFTIEELSTKYSDIVGQAVLNEIQTDTELEIDKLISIGVINVDKNNNYSYPLFINGNSESDYVNAFRKTNATGRNMARLMVMDMKLNYLNSQIKTIQYLKFDPALAFKTSIDVKDKTISDIADEDKVTIANTTWDEFSKRAAALVAPGSQGSWSWNIGEDLYKEASKDYITVTAKDVKVEVKNADGTLLNKSEITDAEEFVTMQEHIDYLMSQGKIPYETWLSIYNKIKKAGPGGYYKLTSEELTLTISPTKPVYVNYTKVGDKELGLNRIDYVKSSRYPLIPQQEAGSERDKLRVWMEKNNVRSVNFASAKKLGRPTKSLELFDKDNNFVEPSDDDFKSSMQLLSRDGIRNQQEIPEQKDKVSTVTQMNRTIFDGLLGVKNFNFGNMKNVTGSKGKELKEAVRARLFEIESENLKEKIGNLNVSHEKLYELLKDIIENDTTGSYTQNDLLALEIDPQTKKFKIPLEAQYKLKKFQSLINSLIDKNVMLKVDGSSFVQVSGVGNKYTFSNISKGIKSDIIWIDKYADDFAKDGATLKYIRQEDNKTKAAQVIVSQYLRDDEGNLIDLTDYITEDDFGRNILDTSKMDEKMFQLVGTRIPNQSHPSTLPIEVVGFLPSYMENSIIVPDGITGQMGSDFDVDKLYAYFSKFKYTKKSTIERLGADENEFEELVKAGKKIAKKAGEKADRKGRYNNFNKYLTQAVKEKYGDKEVPKFKIETPASIKQITYELNSINDVKNLDKDQLNQLYRDIHWEVLMNSATFDKITKAVDMPEVKEKVNLRNEQLKKYNLISDVKVNLPLDYMTSITRYIDNRSGKTGVSIFATLISAQADFQDKVIQLKRDEETNTPNPIEIKLSKNSETIYLEFIGKLGESTSFLNEKRSISENLNMMFSESVDNAKNQFLKEFNWTEKAMSPIGVLAMLTDNKGNAAPIDFMMDLTSQSSIITLFEMIEQKQDSFGQYDVDALSKSIVELQNKIIKKIDLKGYLPGDQTAESYFNRKNQNRNSILDAETLSETWMIGKAIQQKASNETLEKIAKDLKYGSVNEMMLTYYNVQFNALDMFARLENTGRELMTILGAVYPYTKGIGSNVFSTKQKLNQLNKLSSSLVFDNLDNIAGEINKLSNGDIQIMPIGEIGSAIENSLIFAQNNIYKSLFPISSGNELESTVDIILDFLGLDKLNLSKDKYQSIYNTVFESIISYIYTNPSFELFEDVVTERNKLINGTTSIGYRIGELNKNPEFAKNGFLKNIEVDKDYKTNTYSISFKNPFGTESDDKEVTLGFYNLALNENNDIKQLAKDLALYPFATGDAGNLGRFIPVTYLNSDADFNKAMSNFENAFVKHLINPESQDILIDQIVQNNPEMFSKSFSFTTTKTSYTDYQSPFKTALKKNINVDRLKDVNKFTFKIGDFPNDDKHKGIIQSLKISLTDNEQKAINKIPSLANLKIDFKYPQYILIDDEIKSDIDFIYNEKVSYLYKRTSAIVTENGDATYERIEILGYKNISEFDFNNPNLVSVIEMNNVSRNENELRSQEGVLNQKEEVVKSAAQTFTSSDKPNLLKNENGLIIIENVIPKSETIKIIEQAKDFIEETSFKQTAGSVSWAYGKQWMRINAMNPKQREGLITGKQLNGIEITQKMKDDFIKTGVSKGFPLYGYTTIDKNGNILPSIPQNIIDYLFSKGINVSEYDASYNSIYDKSDNGSLIIHQDNTENNESPIITISLGRPMKFITYELNDPTDFNVADTNNTAFRIAVNAVRGEALKLNLIPKSAKDNNGNIKYGHFTPDTILKYAEEIDKKQGTQLKQFVIDKLKEQFKNAEKTEYDLTNGAVLVFSGNNRNVLHEIVFDEETNKKPMESGFPTLNVNKAFKGLNQADRIVKTDDYRGVLTLRKVEGPTLTNVINEQKLIENISTQPTTSAQESTSNFVVKNNILEILNKSKYSFLASLLKENNTTLNWTKDNNVAGTYYLGKNKIEIGEHIKFSDNLEEVIAHEAIHAIIDWETTGTEKRKEMEEKIAPFIKEIKEYFFNSKEGQNEYIKNILTTFNQSLINKNGTFEEVITYAFTDKIFAEWLNSIPSKGVKNKSKTLWGKLKDIILEILSPITEKTKLDELNDILDFIFKEEVKPGIETTEPVKTYQGKIESLQPNQIFVFGSNPQGRHGAGAAQQAKNKFGAVQFVGRGLKNQTYALVTKNLTAGFVEKETGIKYEKAGEKSLTPEQIESNIKELYNVALQNPDKEFLVAYSVDDKKNLNGYTDQDIANMFSAFPIPNNMVFEEGFSKLLFAKKEEIVEELAEQPKVKVSTVEYKGKTFIIEGSEEEGGLKIFYQAQGGKGEEVKDVNLFNKVFVAHTADIHPEWVVTLTGIQNQPKYLVGNNSEVISLQNTDYGKVIQSKDVIQKVMSLYYDKSQIENLKIKPEETSMSTENVFDITKEDLPVEQKPVKKEKRINVPKGSNPNNNVIMETEDTVFLMNNGQQEAFNFIKGKVEELLNNKKRIDVNDLDNTVIFNDPLTNKFNGLFPVEMWNNMIGLAGRGGVGKTTVIKAIIAAIEGKNKYAQPSVMYLAPSHTAATVLQEAIGLDSEKANDGKVNTIQSHLRMRPDSNNIFNLISEYNYLKSAKFKPSFGQPNIIIIDEASMVSAIMIKDMITRLKTDLRNGLISNMPVFIFMGDYRQLGPINEKQNQFVNKGPISSTLFLDNSKTKELTEVMRSDNELLHKIYDSIGEQTVSNMTKTKNKEELKNPSFSKYDQLTKKSTENMLIVSNQEGVIDDYVTYLSNNNNPYGMFWIHYNNTDNSITKNLAAKIRKAYFDKIEQPILEEKYRLFSKHDYIEFTGGVEISTDDNFNYTITDDKIKNLIEKQKYNKIEDNVYKIGLGVIKPNARFKVLDIVNRKDNLSALLHPNLKSYLPKNIIVDVETSILYNRQDKIRALSKALDISVGPIIDGKFGRYSEGTKSQEGITIKNNKTGEILAKFDLPYGTFIDVEENLKMLNSTNATMPFVPSYIGSSHTAQGNSIKNVIVGDYNIKQAAANGKTHIDDVFSSMYVALTRTSGTVIIIKPAGADIVNNQEVFLGAITDDNQAQRMTSASEMPNKFEEIEIQEAEETIDFMDNVIQQIIMDSQKEVIEDTFGKDKNASSILNTVYKNTTPFYKEILKLVSKTGGIGNLKIVVDENMTDPGSYDLYNETITINPNLAFELNPGNANALYDVLIHELLHHVTAKIVNADKSTLTLEQRKWVVSLENLFKFTQDKILNDPIHSENLRKTIEQVNKEGGFLSVKDKSMYYGLTNINEFISMLMSDADFRSFMNNVSYSGEKSLFERFIDIFVNILKSLGVTVKDDTVLKEGIGNIIGIIESRNEGNVATNQTLKSIKTQTFVDGIVESEFEKIIKYLDIKTKCK